MSNDRPSQTTRTRDPMWMILPGLLFYNLIGRHVLRWRSRRQWIAEGRDPKMLLGEPGWITLADVRSAPLAGTDHAE